MGDVPYIGLRIGPVSVPVERGQLRLFAKATGQTDPLFCDEAAAVGAGYRGLVAPPTFAICLYMLAIEKPLAVFEAFGASSDLMLHAEQRFDHCKAICAGDTVTFAGSVTNVAVKKAGALKFVTLELTAHNQLGQHVATQAVTIALQRGVA